MAETLRRPSLLERAFLTLCKMERLPEPETEVRFHPTRKWRFDFAYPETKIGIECEGGTYSGGRHVRGEGFENDCEKYSEAAIAGWCVIRVTGNMLDDGRAIALVRRALASRQQPRAPWWSKSEVRES